MSKAVRNYMRQNADAFARHHAASFLILGSSGGFMRPSGGTAKEVIARVTKRHCRKPASPTLMPLTLLEAASFLQFKINPDALPLFWIAIVSDEAGRCAFGIAQEGDPAISPQITRTYARALAQSIACESLLKMERLDGVPAGSA